MILFIYFTIALFISISGIKRAYQKKSYIILVWAIIFYYVITSYISCCSHTNADIPTNVKILYFRNFTFCIAAFLIADIFFNKRINPVIDINILPRSLTLCLEGVFWFSLALVFITLYGQSYSDFVTSSDGGGWGIIFFQVSAGMILWFSYKKEWVKVIIASMVIILIILTTHVRSLFLYSFLPIIVYFINRYYKENLPFKSFCIKLLPLVLITVAIGFFFSFIRFGFLTLPETNLTDISLSVLDKIEDQNYQYQGFNSFKHYFWGFISPIASKLGIHSNLPDSIPLVNAIYQMDVSYSSIINNAVHFPANIFHDMYLSWGNFACVFAFAFYSYLLFIIRIFQTNAKTLLLLSSTLPWHLYMLLRGSVDYSSMGISYALYFTLIIYIVSKLKLNLR